MILNELGTIAKLYWKEIPAHHGNAVLDEFIIMPNHIHGIIVIVEEHPTDDPVATLHATSLHRTERDADYFSAISPKKGSLSTIVRSYTSSVTRKIHQDCVPTFAWQARYYDQIIRTARDLENIRMYIASNPINWQTDSRFTPEVILTHA